MALTKVINDLADLNQSGSTNALKGCAGTTAQQPASSSTVEYLMVAGGGGGGGWGQSGGGGAGGYVTGSTTVYHGTPTVITVGEGGAGGYSNSAINSIDVVGLNGDDSGFNGFRAIGGGGGGSYNDPGLGTTITYAVDGGSGGGAGTQGQNNNQFSGEYGEGVTGQGNDGGTTYNASGGGYVSPYMSAGGGGAGAPGSGGLNAGTGSGNGGVGIQIDDVSGINMISSANAVLAGVGENSSGIWVSGGGGGGAFGSLAATGGKGGGGNTTLGQSNGLGGDGDNATVNTGGGGGGASGYSNYSSSAGIYYRGGAGGSGLGILKYNNTEVSGYTLNSEDTYTVNWPADKYGVAYWPLNLDVKDVGGHYDGTATDITYVTGKFNQAASFNGSSSYIDTTFYVPPTSSLSSSVWFKTSSTTYRHCLFSDFNVGGSDPSARFSLFVNASDNFEVIFGDGSTSDIWNSVSASSYLDGNWHNVVLTANGAALKLYVDGSLIGTDTFNIAVGTAGAQSMVLGRIGDYSGGYWNGQLEQMRFYASELSSTDVQDIYNNSKPGSLPPLKTSSDLTTTTCNYPSGTTGTALYQFQGNADDSCTTPVAYDLTEVGSPSYVTGKFGEAISFNGTSQGVTSTSAVIPTPAATISLWFNGNGTASTEFYIIGAGVGGSSYGLDIHYYNDGSGGHFYGGVVDGGSFQGVGTGDTIVDTNTWYHLALTWDGSTSANSMKLYLNGVLETNITPTVTAASLTYSSFGIGKTGTSTYAPGIVDQVRIYGSVLTSQQIYDLWQKENNIQTHFSSTDPADTTPANTDILVFKEGSGEITFKNDSPPGAEVGMLRYNSTLGQMEHFNSGGWKDFTNCTTSVCNYPVTASALYQFKDNVNDTCGSYNGTEIGSPTYVPGKFGKAISLNGSTQAITLPSILPTNSTASSSSTCWFKTTYSGPNMGTIFSAYDSYGGGTSSTPGFGLWTEGNQNFLRMADYYLFGSVVGTDGTANVSNGNWHFVAVVFDYSAGTLNCYLDGNSTPEISITGTSAASVDIWTANASIGYQKNPGGASPRYFNGEIDQVRIFPSALSQTQITELYNEVYCP